MLSVLTVVPGLAASSTVTVTPATLSPTSWYFYDDTGDNQSTTQVPGKYEFVTGPSNPPAGVGSVRFQTIGNERWNMATSMFANTPLSSLNTLKFNTYVPSAQPAGATCGTASNECDIYLNFDVDFGTGLPGYQRRLVYVPKVNGNVTFNTWQEWDATNPGALWTWSGYVANGNKWPDGNTDEYRTWMDIKASFLNAHINENAGSSKLLFRAGEPYATGFIGNLDKVTVGIGSNTTVFDFEPFAVAKDKDDCKGGGWQTLKRADGSSFKNQGDCVSYTNNGK